MKWLWPKNKTSMPPTTPLPLLFLGKGGQGIVFGPFSYPQLLDSLSVPLSQQHQQTQYILKFTLFPMKRDDADAIRDQNKKEVRLLKRMLGSSQGSIILPRDYLVMTLMDILRIFGIPFQTSSRSTIQVNKRSWKTMSKEIRPWIEDGLEWLYENPDEPNGYYIVEIQPFGGMDFFEISTNLTFPWSYSMFLQLWTTWLEALYACLKLIMKHHLFVSDLKPENMVYNPHDGLRLIDVDVMLQSSILEGFQKGSLEVPVISVSALVLPVQMINPLFFNQREMDSILRAYLYRCNKNRDLLKSLMNDQREPVENVSQNPCSSKIVRSWERTDPISKRIEDLAVWNVFYPMMMSMLLFIRQLEIYQRRTRSEMWNMVMMRRMISMVKKVLRYLLNVRMKNVDPDKVLTMLCLLPYLTNDSKTFGFILDYLKTKDEKIWKQLKGRYDTIYQSHLLLPEEQRKEKVLGQQVRQHYF